MRIAQIIDSLAPGGAERLQVTFAETAIARNIKPTVIFLAKFPNTPILDQLQATGIDLVEFSGRNLLDLSRFIRLTLYLRKQKFDILHAHLGYAIILGIIAGLLSGTPVVATLHNVRSDKWSGLEKFILWLGACKIIAVGEVVREAHFSKPYKKRIIVIANPVKQIFTPSQSEIEKIRKDITGDIKKPLLISVGRLEPQKGYVDLITSIDIVRKTKPTIFLAIAGTGILEETILKQIKELGLEGNVSLLGLRNDVPRLLSASDIFISSSHWEGMPIAVLEAMSAGLPVIATSVGDVPKILNQSTGILVKPKAPEEISAAITKLLDNPLDRSLKGSSAKEYVIKHHDVNHWLDQLMNVYRTFARK